MSVLKNNLEKAISDELQIYAEKEYSHQLITAMLSNEKSSHISIHVDSMGLFESSIRFAHYIFRKPKDALHILDDAFQKVALTISKNHILKADMVYRENLHARLVALPNLPEVYHSNLPNCSDIGQFLCIKGTVTRTSTTKMLQYMKLWRCSKCKYQFSVEAEVELGYICEKPLTCPNPEWCSGKNFTLLSTDINLDWCKDFQEIKLQEQVYNLNVGTVPRSMTVILENDLVESCHPGNDVIVSGILIQRWKPLIKGKSLDIELVILAHNIEVQNKMAIGVVSKGMADEFGQFWLSHKSDPLKGRNFILSCICPQVFGLYVVKLAVALVLAGGVQKKDGNSRIRGDSHLLLIGDPGTAKSQFLKFATKVCPRSVITSGIGTTNAGLTVSAIKESGRWQLEAGALVLADGGVCCIDEFSCIKEQDKTCIHEAMEQQTISVAKAGLVCSLNTRCSILAATNPKGNYDENMSISENTALGTPLLSRFDIILVLLDKNDETWDEMVSSYILNGRNFMSESNISLWSVDKMKSYFSLIRQIKPQVTPDAERVLQAYYTRQRHLQARSDSRSTPRLLQSLIRLAEGHARLMFRSEVLVLDAVMAVILIESSMVSNSILEGISPLLTIFPSDPVTEYIEKAKIVLKILNVDLPIHEKYGRFYDEVAVQKMLFTISELLISKNKPFIFENYQNRNVSSTDGFQDSSTSVHVENEPSNMTFEDSSANNSEILKPTERGTQTKHITVEAEVHHHDISISVETERMHIDSNTDTENIQSLEKADNAQSSILKPQICGNIDNLSFLQQILEDEPPKDIDNFKDGKESILVDQLSTLSDIKSIFDKKVPKKVLYDKDFPLESTAFESMNIHTSRSQRDTSSLLLELGISPEKEIKKLNTNTSTDRQAQKVTSGASLNIDIETLAFASTHTAKKSLADKLMSFTFSKCQNASQKKFQNSQVDKFKSKINGNTTCASNAKSNWCEQTTDLLNNVKTVHDESRIDNFYIEKQNKDSVVSSEKIQSIPTTVTDNTAAKILNYNAEICLRETTNQITEPTAINPNTSTKGQNASPPEKREFPDKLKKFLFSKKRKT